MTARARLTAIRKLALYLFIPGLSATSALVAIPAITSRFGAAGWASVAVGLSVGATGGAAVDLGWSIVGPQLVARSDDEGRATYAQSLSTKVLALICVAPLAACVAALLGDFDRVTSALLALGTLISVLSPAWYFVGRGTPGKVMMTDTAPRLAVAFASALAVQYGAPLFVYGVGNVVAPIAVFLLGARSGRLPLCPTRTSMKTAPSVIWGQRLLILGNVVSTLFTSAPVSILAAFNGSLVVATYSAVDRPLRMGLNILGGVPARLQSWVGVPDRFEGRRRAQRSVWINIGLGALALIGFFLLAPFVGNWLFSGSVRIDFGLSALGGVVALLICASRGLGLALVSEDRSASISVAVYLGAGVGVVALLLLPIELGAAGGLLAVILAETVLIVVQAMVLRRVWVLPLAGFISRSRTTARASQRTPKRIT